MASKVGFTLERLLYEVLYKEDVQNLLDEYGESISGAKPELIDRFLNSAAVQNKSVNLIARDILRGLTLDQLRLFGDILSLDLPTTKANGVRRLTRCVEFEPYTRSLRRGCSVCRVATTQELHFGPDWRASYFRCGICKNKEDVSGISRPETAHKDSQSKSESLADEPEKSGSEGPFVPKMSEEETKSLLRTEQQSKTTLEAVIQIKESLGPLKLAENVDKTADLGDRMEKESKESVDRFDRMHRKTSLWAVDGMLLTAGIGIPSLGAMYDSSRSLVYLVVGSLFLIAFVPLTI